MRYGEMSDDLLRFLDSRSLEQVTLVGHNIGGKTAMCFAGRHSERIKGLIVLDTAPVATASDKVAMTLSTIQSIRALDVEGKSKKAALEVVQSKFQDKGIANMISNNLAYTEDDNHATVRWCVNLDAIIDNLEDLCGFEPASNKYQGPTFFLNGEKSVKYPEHIYTDEFPNAKLH
jgi:pimeloyl-ACP methyl ester carboxylesterase